MSDTTVEKSLLYLFMLSFALHAGAFALLYYLPEAKSTKPKQPIFIEMQDTPDLHEQLKTRKKKTPILSDRHARVEDEMAPRGKDTRNSASPVPSSSQISRLQKKVRSKSSLISIPATGRGSQAHSESQKYSVGPGSSASGLLKTPISDGQQNSQPQIFPSASRLAKLEESYRRKYEKDIAEGNTHFLNSDDIQFGSFLRRFENAVYGVWRYPSEAAKKGIEGITPVRITFNRRGEILNVKLLESSGAKILDDEVFRTISLIGPVGAFPKGFNKDEFHLIAFFQYGGSQKSLR
jgi:periplasmic protein TonB